MAGVTLLGNPSVHDAGDPVLAGRGDRIARNLLVPLLIILVAVIAVFYVLFDVSRVEGESMIPTLRNGDRLLLTKGYSDPRRGDIVVLLTSDMGTPLEIVKRVVALPGDTVEVFGDVVMVNNRAEAPVHIGVIQNETPHIPAFKLPIGSIFVMGDNRPGSLDSRVTGPMALSSVHGRVAGIFAPIARMRVVPSGIK